MNMPPQSRSELLTALADARKDEALQLYHVALSQAERDMLINALRSESRSPEGWRAKSKEDKDALAGACLAFAAMLKEDYGVGKQAALTCIAAAYETNEAAK